MIKNGDGVDVVEISTTLDNSGSIWINNRYGVRASTIWGVDTGSFISTLNKDGVRGTLMETTDEGGFIVITTNTAITLFQ